jgi:hypothetical protein
LFAARDANSEVLACLIINFIPRVAAHDPVEIRDDLTLLKARPSLEDDDLVELLALGLVHVHHDDTRLRLGVRREMLLHESALRDREGIGVGTIVPSILRKLLP